MSNVVVVFESRYGQTEKIAHHIVGRLLRAGHTADLCRASLATRARLEGHDGIVVVGAVYFGEHAKEIARFVRVHRDTIASMPFAFVSVSNSAASTSLEARAQATRLAHAFVDDAALSPRVVITTGGALAYPRYNFLLRFVMRRIAKENGAPVDTSRIHELTNWEQLTRDLQPFLAAFERPLRQVAATL